ncbi:MAG: ABC transporter permease [Candidatus Lokiarchaeota archaeon]|nr:ABC transporter permease [Candidatus Lokiarchaeota archaeon]
MIKTELPPSLRQMGTVFKYEMKKFLEGKRFKLSLTLSIIIPTLLYIFFPIIMNLIFQGNIIFNSIKIYYLSNIPIMSYTIILFPIIFSADSLSFEYQKKTGLLLFVQPVYKRVIFLGKYLSSLILNFFVILICFIFMFFSGFFFYPYIEVLNVVPSLMLALMTGILTSIAYLSIIFLFNSLTNRGIYTVAIMVFLCYVLSPFFMPVLLPGNKLFIPFFNLPYISMQLMMTIFTDLSTINTEIAFEFTDVFGGFSYHLMVLTYILYCIIPIIFISFWEEHKKMN